MKRRADASVGPDCSRFVTHLRLVYFTLIAACLITIIAISSEAPTPAGRAYEQTNFLLRLNDRWHEGEWSAPSLDDTLEQCSKDGYKVSVVVVDKAGNVAASVRGDGTNPHTIEFGRLKAYTARTRGQTSLEFKNLTDKPENAYLKQIPNVVAVGGGVPIKIGNEVIGAVGVSGAPGGEKDEACANAGIAKVAASLN